jgi:hypothetical protein
LPSSTWEPRILALTWLKVSDARQRGDAHVEALPTVLIEEGLEGGSRRPGKGKPGPIEDTLYRFIAAAPHERDTQRLEFRDQELPGVLNEHEPERFLRCSCQAACSRSYSFWSDL